jgi:hypothetical protein
MLRIPAADIFVDARIGWRQKSTMTLVRAEAKRLSHAFAGHSVNKNIWLRLFQAMIWANSGSHHVRLCLDPPNTKNQSNEGALMGAKIMKQRSLNLVSLYKMGLGRKPRATDRFEDRLATCQLLFMTFACRTCTQQWAILTKCISV